MPRIRHRLLSLNFLLNPTDSSPLTDSERRRMVQLSRIFLCKAMECIYINRCPGELSDLSPDEDNWFSLKIDRSESLRQLTAARHSHGWFQINFTLTDPDVQIERWTLLHSEPKQLDETLSKIPRSELKQHVIKNFARTLRAIVTLVNALPTKTLEYALEQAPTCTRRITAVCSRFHSTKFKEDPFICEGRPERRCVGRVVTPIGTCKIICDSITDLTPYLPRLLSISPRPSVRLPVAEPPAGGWRLSADSFSGSSAFSGNSLTRSDSGLMRRDSSSALDLLEFSTTAEGQMSRDVEMDGIDEFLARIERVVREFPKDEVSDVAAVRKIFVDVQDELTRWEGQLVTTAD
jgi:hypothetical protein